MTIRIVLSVPFLLLGTVTLVVLVADVLAERRHR